MFVDIWLYFPIVSYSRLRKQWCFKYALSALYISLCLFLCIKSTVNEGFKLCSSIKKMSTMLFILCFFFLIKVFDFGFVLFCKFTSNVPGHVVHIRWPISVNCGLYVH